MNTTSDHSANASLTIGIVIFPLLQTGVNKVGNYLIAQFKNLLIFASFLKLCLESH